MKTEFPLSQETNELWDEYVTCRACRDQCVKSLFKAKRAIYYGKQAEAARIKFWNQVRETYPEELGTTSKLEYFREKGIVILSEE